MHGFVEGVDFFSYFWLYYSSLQIILLDILAKVGDEYTTNGAGIYSAYINYFAENQI